MATIDDYLRRAVAALELAIDDPETMEPTHYDALNRALSEAIGVQYARADDAAKVSGAGQARVDGDPKF